MTENKHVDVVKLDEKTLWKLHEKLTKIRAKEIASDDVAVKETPQQRPRSKPAKFLVYQPGVTRLSNRKLAANFDRTTVESQKEKGDSQENVADQQRHQNPGGCRQQSDNSVKNVPSHGAAKNINSPKRNRRARRSNYRRRNREGSDNRNRVKDEEYEAEEGFLARHQRRKKNGENVEDLSDVEAGKIEDDDELAWDNYGGSGLVHTGWSPQVTGTEMSSQDEIEFSDRELYEEEAAGEGSAGEKRTTANETHKTSEENQASSEEDVPSVATSESNKEYYRVAHTVSSQSETDENLDEEDLPREREDDDDYEDDESYEDDADAHREPSSKSGKTKKQLFDPDNPESPILVKKPQGRRGEGHYSVPMSGDNVYNPSLSKERMMVNIKPARPRRHRSPVHYSPPRYHGNYYPEEEHWQGGYDTPSPTARMRPHPSENLSEDEDTASSRFHSSRHHSCMNLLHEAEQHEASLSGILSAPSFDSQEYAETLTRVRNKLKKSYEAVIISNIEFASKNNVEQLLWRNVYYQVIEILREQIRSCPEQEGSELRLNLVLLLDQGTAFYESLLENLQHKNRFNLKEILNNPSARKRHRTKARKRAKLAIVSCQRVFICLGDIARYREQANNSSNYGRARHCYLQAQILAPKNGRPYNQLAVLAVKTRHKLDAVYYYIRSLAASNPILSARESLMALFDEIRRKLDYVKQKKDSEAAEKSMSNLKVNSVKKNARSGSKVVEGSPRRWEEVWILPGTTAEVAPTDVKNPNKRDADSDFPELRLPAPEIAKHFVLLFLNIHGKLFTRIGLESFSEILTKTLRLFEITLENPKLMSSQRLLQLYAINLFSVLNADKLSIHGSVRDSTQNQRRALQLVFSMFAVTINQANKIFRSSEKGFDPFTCERLSVLLPSVKVFFDWMYANKDCWYSHPKDLTDSGFNIWESLADLCDWACSNPCTKSSVQIYNEPDEGLEEVFLSEDSQLAGFSPLGQAFSDPRYVEPEFATVENKLYVQQCVRMNLVREFLVYLCGLEEPLLAFKQGKYVAVVPNRASVWSDKSNHEDSFMSSDYDIDDYSAPGADKYSSSEGNNMAELEQSELSELRMYRDSLQMAKDLHEKRKNQIQNSLEKNERVKLEICPKYLVPDTNCFIDHLDLIEKLVNCGKFTVSTPLVVISELEGLATEKKGSSGHAENVHRCANFAVDYINNCFSNHNSRFCALTRRGTELKSLRFRSEESVSAGTNDDFILESTHAYALSHSKKNDDVVDGERVVHGTVVLLTDDRNLRLKALLLQDMATKNIVDFCKWVKI